ncbi:MAG TPA: porin [Vicinamibacteria bacterium]
MKTAVMVLVLAASATGARAQEEQPEPSPPPGPAPAPVVEKKAPVSFGPGGVVLESETGDYRLQLRGYAQFDGRFFGGDEGRLALDTFVLRRVRPILRGAVHKHFEFNITPDFGGGAVVLQDAFLDVNYSPKARVRVGKFKSPVGLERLQPATALAFVERAYPSVLLPIRDVGVQLHGELGGVLAYAVGVFDGAPDGGSVDLDVNDGKDFAGRLFVTPFARGTSALRGLGFGLGGTTGVQSGPLPAYRSGGQVSIVTLVAGITADGRRTRLSPQLRYERGPLGLMAEYARSEARVLREATGERATFSGEAWQAAATFVLTGEPAAYTGVRPGKPFDPARGQWGALELAGRVTGLELGGEGVREGLIDPTVSVREAFAWALGLNWHLNRNVKQVVNFERTTFSGGASRGDRRGENAFFFRTQFSF